MIDRRTFLRALAAAGWASSGLHAEAAASVQTLWPGEPPGGGGPSGPSQRSELGEVSAVAVPTLTIHRPSQPNGTAVVVAGGGGYTRIEMASEAEPAAAWLVARGITAAVLTYRLPGEGWRDGPLAPLQDAQRAIRMMRAAVGPLCLDPHRIGVLGYSAGGHLMGLAATWTAARASPTSDAIDALEARPDFAALIYPVVTLQPPFDHTSSRRQMIGFQPSPALSAEWSVETHVGADSPPLFLVDAEDDPIVDPQNSRLLAAACTHAGVPVELHMFPSGGHGFGLGHPRDPTSAWPGFYDQWLVARGLRPVAGACGGAKT